MAQVMTRDMVKTMRLDNPQQSPYWDAVHRLNVGGSFQRENDLKYSRGPLKQGLSEEGWGNS